MARNLVRFDPLAELSALQKQLFADGGLAQGRTAALPTTDVYTEDDKQMTVEVHLPNFSDDDVNVSVDQGALIIQAERHDKDVDDTEKRYVVRESSPSFYRRIVLPEQADDAAIQASFDGGLLRIVVPFHELPSPRRIELSSKPAKRRITK